MSITVSRSSVDSYGRATSRSFKTLAGAQKFAHDAVGATPEMGSSYAVSGDGVCKVTVTGCTLAELFPALSGAVVPAITEDYRIEAKWDGYEALYQVWFGTRLLAAYDREEEAAEHVGMCRQHDADVAANPPAVDDLDCPF